METGCGTNKGRGAGKFGKGNWGCYGRVTAAEENQRLEAGENEKGKRRNKEECDEGERNGTASQEALPIKRGGEERGWEEQPFAQKAT